MIEIGNRGQELISTNYWQSEMASAGKVFCSCNAGAVRVLLPQAQAHVANDLRAARHVVLSRGPMEAGAAAELGIPEAIGREMIELMWDAGTHGPFCLHLVLEAFDHVPAAPPIGNEWVCIVYTERHGAPHRETMHVCHWRRVWSLPCREPWHG
jgi:hypothetical protein